MDAFGAFGVDNSVRHEKRLFTEATAALMMSDL